MVRKKRYHQETRRLRVYEQWQGNEVRWLAAVPLVGCCRSQPAATHSTLAARAATCRTRRPCVIASLRG
jgi:hypothetical protein